MTTIKKITKITKITIITVMDSTTNKGNDSTNEDTNGAVATTLSFKIVAVKYN